MLLIVLYFMSSDHEGTGDEGGSLSRTAHDIIANFISIVTTSTIQIQ